MKHKDEILKTWTGLNAHLQTADEAECSRLIKLEEKGPRKSVAIMIRIHSRLNYLRAHRERAEILAKAPQ